MQAPKSPSYVFGFTGFKRMFMDDVYDKAPSSYQEDMKFLKTIPDLKGQIIGNNTIVWGHKISFKKWTNPIFSKYGDVLSENAGMTARCECGWTINDIIPLVAKTKPTRFPGHFGGDGKERFTTPHIDFNLLEKVILDHIQGTFVEMEYVVIPMEFLEDIPDGFRKALLSLLKESGAILHCDFDVRSWLLIDDAMSDSSIAQLTEMLEGYEIGTRKVRVLKHGS